MDYPKIEVGKAVDLTGKKFGRLVVLYRTNQTAMKKRKEAYWLCQCECGEKTVVAGNKLRSGNTQSCGCLQKEKTSQRSVIDLLNKKFGYLTVIKRDEDYIQPNGQHIVMWQCRCDCGKVLSVRAFSLMHNITQSCGCMKESHGEYKIKEILQENNISFIQEKQFEDCRFEDTNWKARFDFYLPEYNCCIEYDGRQHFQLEESGFFTSDNLIKLQKHDIHKNNWCKDNNIILIRIPYTRYDNLCLEDLLPETSHYKV